MKTIKQYGIFIPFGPVRKRKPGLGTSKVNIGRTIASSRAVAGFKPNAVSKPFAIK